MHPYTENPIRHTRGRTRNWRDSLNIFEGKFPAKSLIVMFLILFETTDSHGPEGKYDPVFKLDFLGGVIKQGLVGYITMVQSQFIPTVRSSS